MTNETPQQSGVKRSYRPRRKFSPELKREMVEKTLSGDVSVSVVARQYDVNANLLFKWRRTYLKEIEQTVPCDNKLLPITVTPAIVQHDSRRETTSSSTCKIEVSFASGHHMAISGVHDGVLKMLLENLAR